MLETVVLLNIFCQSVIVFFRILLIYIYTHTHTHTHTHIHIHILEPLIKSFKSIKKKKYLAAQLFPTFIINHHIIMISEGSCDIDDWRNG